MTGAESNNLILKSALRYSKYCLNGGEPIISDDNNIKGFPIRFDKFDLTQIIQSIKNLNSLIREVKAVNGPLNLKIYSLPKCIENSIREDWNSITINILKDPSNCYVFIYNSGFNEDDKSNEIYTKYENTDDNFCHSRLLRDFVKKHKIGFEIDLGLKEKEFEKVLKEKMSVPKWKIPGNNFNELCNKIVKSVNDYFQNNKTGHTNNIFSKKIFKKYITDFYAYNLNSQAFKGTNTEGKVINKIKLSDVSTGHELYGSVLSAMKKPSGKDISKNAKWQIYLNILSDLAKLLVHHCKINNKLKILLLDDRPDKIEEEINEIGAWLGGNVIENKDNKLIPLEKLDKLFNALEEKKNTNDENVNNIKGNIEKGEYDFIIIDLDYEGELKGFDYLRKLRKAKSVYAKPFVIVFTRNEDPKSVQKALNMGALFFASKQNFARLLLELYKVLPLVKNIIDTKEENYYSLGHNWSLLYQLPLAKILELKNKNIMGDSYVPFNGKDNYGFNEDKIKCDAEYLWINKLPKAELHCHIGSVLGPELIPLTSLLVLSQKYAKENSYDNISLVVEFLLPIVSDPFLFEEAENDSEFNYEGVFDGYDKTDSHELKNIFICDDQSQYFNQSIFSIVADSLNLKAKNKTPEEVLLSPQDDTLERHFHHFSRLKSSPYYERRIKLKENGVSYDEIMLFFILLLHIRQELNKKVVKNELTIGSILSRIQEEIEEIFNKADKQSEFKFPNEACQKFNEKLKNILDNHFESLKTKFYTTKDGADKNVLKYLISAHSKQRCLPFDGRGLFNYLRGCEYGGAPHLQSNESIFLAAHHIVYKYAIPDNIRYLDLRCAIDGYNKFKLFDDENEKRKNKKDQSLDKVVDDIKHSFNYWQKYAYEKENRKVHINIIVTAKRHKSVKEFEDNVELTVRNYSKQDLKAYSTGLFNGDTQIVSFDIAGLEKNNRVSKFKDQLIPLLDNCVPITMHAGEEDSHEAIWEAIYLAHAQRIGHALTLVENKDLMNMVRDTYVNIELCPMSNYLTNNIYYIDKNGEIKHGKKYPLKEYLKERLAISVNTDNPYVSDTDLSKEFLFAARLSGGLTKWEILKIILYSFKSITINKNIKSDLLKEINEEIFELILDESELL